jgi:hypothetical protein
MRFGLESLRNKPFWSCFACIGLIQTSSLDAQTLPADLALETSQENKAVRQNNLTEKIISTATGITHYYQSRAINSQHNMAYCLSLSPGNGNARFVLVKRLH